MNAQEAIKRIEQDLFDLMSAIKEAEKESDEPPIMHNKILKVIALKKKYEALSIVLESAKKYQDLFKKVYLNEFIQEEEME